jgi:hypothetical protein
MEIVAILIAGLTLPVEMVARQLVREQLVRRLIEMKSPYALDVSCWEIGGVGYTQAVKTKYIWGPESVELLKAELVKPLLLALRTCDVIRWLSMSVLAFFAVELLLDRPSPALTAVAR